MEWKTKIGIPFELNPRVDYSELSAELSMKEIKRLLVIREKTYEMKHFLEKKEFLSLLKSSTPRPTHHIYWTNKWKASYVIALKDSKRDVITKAELCALPWFFRFNHRPDHVFKAIFHTDYKFTCPELVEGELTWRFYLDSIQVAGYRGQGILIIIGIHNMILEEILEIGHGLLKMKPEYLQPRCLSIQCNCLFNSVCP